MALENPVPWFEGEATEVKCTCDWNTIIFNALLELCYIIPKPWFPSLIATINIWWNCSIDSYSGKHSWLKLKLDNIEHFKIDF